MKKILFASLGLILVPTSALAAVPALFFSGMVLLSGRICGGTVCVSNSNSAPFSPTDIAGLKVWLKADAITGHNDGDTLTAWLDSSGNGNNVSTIAGTPIYETNVVNGLPVVRCNADVMKVATFSGVQPTSIFVVFYRRIDGSAMTIIDGTSQFVQLMYLSSGSGAWNMFSDATQINGTGAATAAWAVVEGNFNGATSVLRSNGTSIASGSIGTLGSGGLSICESGGGSFSLDGDVAEILYYDSTLSAGNRQLVGQYLCTKYAITCTY